MEEADDFFEVVREALPHGGDDGGGDGPIIGFGDAGSYAGEGVAVAAQGDGQPEAALEIGAVEKGRKGLGDGVLAGFAKGVGGPYVVAALGEVVAKGGLDILSDGGLAASVAGHEDGGSGGLGALDALGVVVGDGRLEFGHTEGLSQRVEHPSHGAGAHGRPIAPAVVGLADLFHDGAGGAVGLGALDIGYRGLHEPAAEAAAVATHGAGVLLGIPEDGVGEFVGREGAVFQQPAGDGDGHDAVVGVDALGGEERELGGLDVVELVN